MSKKKMISTLIVILAVAGGIAGYNYLYLPAAGNSTAEMKKSEQYLCPMHPHIISDKEGKCPICGMDLVPADSMNEADGMDMGGMPASTMAKDDSGRKVLYWHDPMVPGKKFDKPGKSPFMDMELVPKYADEVEGGEMGGKPVISISAENIQKMGVRTGKASMATLGGEIRATGIVMGNERKLWNVFTQVEGRIETLKYSAPGDTAKKGDVFYTLYSPELFALQNDYLAATEAGYKDLAAAARKRMKLLGVDERALKTLDKTGKAHEAMPFYVPADGILSSLEVRQGYYAQANEKIADIQNLSNVWVEAEVPEKDLQAIKEGDFATVSVSGSQEPVQAAVDYIYPTIMPETRTGKVRLVLDNPDNMIKPSGYVTVQFATATSEKLTVPTSAILRDTAGNHVILSQGNGKFQTRSVRTGVTFGDRTEILDGLKEDEEIVTSSQFMIDSESSLRESLEKMSGGGDHAGH